MDGIEIFMIAILIACAVVLIVLFAKKKNEDLPPTPTYRPPMAPPTPPLGSAAGSPASAPIVIRSSPSLRPPVSPVTPPPVPSGSPVTSNQHTLYMFERRVSVPKCPRCDGEYDITKEVCCICGYQFRKGVRYS